jgi:hypothetical protein
LLPSTRISNTLLINASSGARLKDATTTSRKGTYDERSSDNGCERDELSYQVKGLTHGDKTKLHRQLEILQPRASEMLTIVASGRADIIVHAQWRHGAELQKLQHRTLAPTIAL